MNKKTYPSISVIMPVYNAAKYLPLSIKSILNQSFKNYELIIIDDGSTDKSLEIIKKYAKKDNRIIFLKNNLNEKICKTLNRGLEMAKGKYIARMDADDWCYPDRLEKQFKFMELHPEVVISGGAMEVCDIRMKTLGVRNYGLNDKDIRNKIFLYSPFCHATTISRSTVLKFEKYNEYLYDSEDYDLYFRLGFKGKFANLPDVLYKMRINDKGVSLVRSSRQELLVLFIRVKAVLEYGYPMTLWDKIYFVIQILSLYIVPSKVKFFIFNLFRNTWRSNLKISDIAISPLVPFWGPFSYFRIFILKSFKNK